MLAWIDYVNLWGCILLGSSSGAGIWLILSFIKLNGWWVSLLVFLAIIVLTMIDEIYQELKLAKEFYEMNKEIYGGD